MRKRYSMLCAWAMARCHATGSLPRVPPPGHPEATSLSSRVQPSGLRADTGASEDVRATRARRHSAPGVERAREEGRRRLVMVRIRVRVRVGVRVWVWVRVQVQVLG